MQLPSFTSALCFSAFMGVLLPGCASPKPTDEADDYYGDAMRAFSEGDQATALKLVNQSIEQKPTAWAYVLRARVYVEKSDFDAAEADTRSGLAMDPNNQSLKWLESELKKPESQRFKGRNKVPPVK